MSLTFPAKFYTTQHKNGFLTINDASLLLLGSKTEVKICVKIGEKNWRKKVNLSI
jgi:hypothetical protein